MRSDLLMIRKCPTRRTLSAFGTSTDDEPPLAHSQTRPRRALLVRAALTQRRPIPSLPAGQRHDRPYNVAGSMNLASST
jgi:hypothetical protein